jgi:hypothetical protein
MPGTTAPIWPAGSIQREEVVQRVRVAQRDAMAALRLLMSNPVGGLEDAYRGLERDRALAVGLAFGVLFSAMLTLSVMIGLQRILGMLGGGMFGMGGFEIGVGDIFKTFLLGFVPFVSLTVATSIARVVFGQTKEFAADVYIAGTSLLPFGLFAVSAAIVGIAVPELILALFMFASVYTIVMLYRGMTAIAAVGEGAAAAAVALMALFAGWLTSALLRTTFTQMMM